MKINSLDMVEAVDFLKVCQNFAKNVNPYKSPTLKDYNGDTSKPWYVEFYYWSDRDQILKRHRARKVPGLSSPNTSNNLKKRYEEFKVIKDAFEYLLKRGWTPEKRIPESDVINLEGSSAIPLPLDAFKHIAKLKSNEVRISTARSYQRTAQRFTDYLDSVGLVNKPLDQIRRKHVLDWLRSILAISKPKTRNNYLNELSTLFEKMIEEEWILRNPCKGIKNLKTETNLHRAYSPRELQIIAKFLSEHDPKLKQYIQFIGYAFLRPSEILKLKGKHINMEEGLITLPAAHAKRGSTEIIPVIDRLKDTLSILKSGANSEDYLFGRDGVPGPNPIYSSELFSERWSKKHKPAINELHGLNLNNEHTLYAMRHTFIQDIYRGLREKMTRQEAEFKIQPITRHKSIESLRKYIRDYSFEVASDWSENYNLDF